MFEVGAVALLDPVGDAGIGGYTHELAAALQAAGIRTTVYGVSGGGFAARLPRSYRLRAAFGASAVRPPVDVAPYPAAVEDRAADVGPLDAYFAVLRARDAARLAPGRPASAADGGALRGGTGSGTGPARGWGDGSSSPEASSAAVAFSEHLACEGFDTVWTQWPSLAPYGDGLRAACAARGMRLVHTVHNVLPHEAQSGDVARHARVYDEAGVLVVHSAQAGADLVRRFPGVAGRVVESRHGTYSLYARAPSVRAGVRRGLDVADDVPVVLFFGGVRPYKNLEALVAAAAARRDILLVVAGWEWGYAHASAYDRLAYTRGVVAAAGAGDRVRLLPGPFGVAQTAALLEACDVVAMPYAESSGSGVLCLALTYGRHVLCTAVGGMAEHVQGYAAATIAESASRAAVAAALDRATRAVVARRGAAEPGPLGALAWPHIVQGLVTAIGRAPRPPHSRQTRDDPASTTSRTAATVATSDGATSTTGTPHRTASSRSHMP